MAKSSCTDMIYLNGQFLPKEQATIAPNDRGFLLSDGLFETIRAYQGKPFALGEHWARLKQSAEFLEIPIDLKLQAIKDIFYQLLDLNQLKGQEACFRLTLTRGTGPRGLHYPDEIHPTLMITVFPINAKLPQAVKINIATLKRNEHSPLANIKSLAYLDNVLARREATQLGFDETILLNTKGHVAETSAGNIFMVSSDNTLVTPALTDGALGGITRQMVLNLAQKNQIKTEVRSIYPEELFIAKEIFLTNSLVEIQIVEQIQHHSFCGDRDAAPLTHHLQLLYKNLVMNHE